MSLYYNIQISLVLSKEKVKTFQGNMVKAETFYKIIYINWGGGAIKNDFG